MARLLLAMACMASCMTGAQAFLPSAVQPATLSLHPQRGHATTSSPGTRRQQRDESLGRVSLLLGGLLAGAAFRSQRRSRVGRYVTLEEIQQLKIEDLPTNWTKITAGKSRRHNQVKGIVKQLEKTFFFMAFSKEGLGLQEMEEARSYFPPSVNVRHLRNTWLKKAMEGTDWAPMMDKVKGSNIYVFVESDRDLKPTIQAYMKIEKQFSRTAKIDELREEFSDSLTYDLQPLVGGMMSEEWDVMEPADIVKLKDFPTKTELIGQIAGSIKQVTTKLAVGVKQVPTKLAIGLKKTVEKGEEGGKGTVGDATPE